MSNRDPYTDGPAERGWSAGSVAAAVVASSASSIAASSWWIIFPRICAELIISFQLP
jgi:hypothetical protein